MAKSDRPKVLSSLAGFGVTFSAMFKRPIT
ncbi:MAG: hypothetical protein QOI33_1430, partial [Mycobacterium sp.]|nr:hypothetical protein [Mycobacterium sp.]